MREIIHTFKIAISVPERPGFRSQHLPHLDVSAGKSGNKLSQKVHFMIFLAGGQARSSKTQKSMSDIDEFVQGQKFATPVHMC